MLVNPAKLVRKQKRIALSLGVRVFEDTPVLAVSEAQGDSLAHRLLTPAGPLTAHRVAFATNAYSHLFGALDRLQLPASTYDGLVGSPAAPLPRSPPASRRSPMSIAARSGVTRWASAVSKMWCSVSPTARTRVSARSRE